ncbi:MAG: cell division protein FtsH, partial [Mesorhizobium sp.]|nr:cell division protein FtsH [Mesorhizobium sp.]
GRALGMVMTLPESDRYNWTYEKALARLVMLFGGREAEIITFGKDKVTTGASGDIQMATNLARSMVMEWGMSEKLGRVRYRSNEQEVFLGHSVAQSTNMSEETAKLIDEEVRRLIEYGETEARRIITKNKSKFVAVAEALLEYETLTGDELRGIMDGAKPARDIGDDTPPSRGSAVPKAGGTARGKKKGPEPESGMEPQPQG